MSNINKIIAVIILIALAFFGGAFFHKYTHPQSLIPGIDQLGVTNLQFLTCGNEMHKQKLLSSTFMLTCLQKTNRKLTQVELDSFIFNLAHTKK